VWPASISATDVTTVLNTLVRLFKSFRIRGEQFSELPEQNVALS
jgi:hypothetical protein